MAEKKSTIDVFPACQSAAGIPVQYRKASLKSYERIPGFEKFVKSIVQQAVPVSVVVGSTYFSKSNFLCALANHLLTNDLTCLLKYILIQSQNTKLDLLVPYSYLLLDFFVLPHNFTDFIVSLSMKSTVVVGLLEDHYQVAQDYFKKLKCQRLHLGL